MQIKAIEDEIDLGQIEEVIEMAKDELELIDFYVGKCHPWFVLSFSIVAQDQFLQTMHYLENKGWELVKEAKSEANEIAAAMADSIYFSSPEARASFKKPEAPKA